MSVTDRHHLRTGPSVTLAAAGRGEESDSAVFQLVEQYRVAVAAGNKPDRLELLKKCPEHAESLAACLDAIDFVHEVVPQLSEQAADGDVAASNWDRPVQALGDYRIVGEIGRGGMAVVYEAEQLSLGRTVALKVLPFAAAMDQQRLQRFRNEATAAATLDHPHIVSVYAVGCERGVHFYAMQHIEGQTLARVIAQLRDSANQDRVKVSDLTGATASETEPPIAPSQPDISTGPIAGISTEGSSGGTAYFRAVAKIGVDASDALDYTHQRASCIVTSSRPT